MYAVELLLDDAADGAVRALWAALDARGVPSLGSVPGTAYVPHVSLAVFAAGDVGAVAAALRPVLAGARGLPLRLEPLGFFVTEEAPAFLGVVPTEALLALHRTVSAVVAPLVTGARAYYAPGSLVPHCTLAMGVRDAAAVHAAVPPGALPIDATVAGAHLVELPRGNVAAALG